MKRKTATILALWAAGTLWGCGGVPAMKYYTLTTPNSMAARATASTLPVTIAVAPLRASQLYRDNRLIYATSNEAMGTYEYERWAQPAPQMIQEVMMRELRASGRYRVIESLTSRSGADFILRGSLYDFKEVSGSPLEARVTLDMDLRDVKTGAIVWTHYYTHDQPVSQKDVSSVVAALDQNVQQGVAEIQSSLDQYLEQYVASHPRQP
jgi:ABC-type uncharacterized transport system auxiliary subunit